MPITHQQQEDRVTQYREEIYERAVEIERLRAALDQIAVCCADNAGRNCNHRMALDFVRQVAECPLWKP